MSFKALVYAYVLGGLTFLPLVVVAAVFFTIYTSVPISEPDTTKSARPRLASEGTEDKDARHAVDEDEAPSVEGIPDVNDIPRTRKGWLTMRRTFEESPLEGSYVTLVRSFLDSRSKDPKRSRPRDMWYVVLKGKVMYLYEDEAMTECDAAVELSGYEVVVYPEGQLDGELFAKRNAICLRRKASSMDESSPIMSRQSTSESADMDAKVDEVEGEVKKTGVEKSKDAKKDENVSKDSWFIFVRNNVEMEDWYFSLIHASEQAAFSSTLSPLHPIFSPTDMNRLVLTLDEQPDVIPMRWLNALIGRVFFSYYRTHTLEAYIIGRLMKKLSKVKRPGFLTDVVVKEVSVGNKPPTLSKPMLKELTKEGDAALEVHLQYKGEIRITVEATATINLGGRFKPYNVKLVLAAVLKELEGNLLVKVKRPPSNRIWYAFTQTPRMVLAVEPIVSDRQITWTMILSTIEARLKEIIQESIVMPNMDDIAFFESSAYQHRGGIWGDASRQNGRPPLFNPDPATADMLSTVSAPAITEDISVDSDVAQSKGDLPSTYPVLAETTSMQSLSTELPGSGDGADGNTLSNSNTISRRKTWFSGLRNDDLSELLSHSSVPDATEQERRSMSDDNLITTDRARPSPSVLSAPPGVSDTSEVEPLVLDQNHLSAPSSRPTSRQSNHKKALSVSSDGSGISGYTDGSAISASSSRNVESTSSSKPNNLPPTPASPTSFLSQLKQRAPDKQAISNTAKETMKKWSMNWANLRKDMNKEREPAGDVQGAEDLPDHSSFGSRLFDPNGSVAQRARQSYAEVRAAVAERRDRDKGKEKEADLKKESGFLQVDDQTSNPIPIPEGGKTRARVISAPGLGLPTSSQSSAISIKDSLSRSDSQNSEVSAIPPPSTSAPSAHAISVAEEEEKPVSPIHRQPQAKMMTIPGIHASHRGDIMSMGYFAPGLHAPSTPNPNDQEGSESKTKLPQNPTISSMYSRFWKSPGSISMGSSPSPSAQATGRSKTADTESSTPRSSTPPISSRAPPPLPPRSTPTAVSRTPTESSQSRALSGNPDVNNDVDPVVRGSPKSMPSASEALKSIASKDDSIRLKRASQEPFPQSSPPSRSSSRRVSTNSSDVSTLNSEEELPPKAVDAESIPDDADEPVHDVYDGLHDPPEDSLPTPTPPPQEFRNPNVNVGPPLPPRRTSVPT